MKKKFVKVALLSLTACAMPTAFVSCDNDDWKAPVNEVNTSVDGLNKTLDAMKGQVSALDSKIAENKAAAEAAAKAAQAAMDAAQAADTSAEDAKKYADEAAQKFAEEAAANAVAQSAEQLKSEVEALMALITANKDAIAEQKALIDGNTSAISANAGKIQGNTQAIAEILESVASLETGNADLAAKLEEANINIENLGKDLSDQVAGLNAAIAVVEGKCEALGVQITDVEEALKKEMGTLEENLAAQITAEVAKLNTADAELKALYDELKKELSDLTIASDLGEVSKMLQQANTQIAALEAFQKKMETDFANLSTKVEGVDQKVEANKTALADLTSALASTEAKASANATAIAANLALINANKAAIKENADAIQNLLDNEINTLNTFKTTYEAQLKTLSTDLTDINTDIENLQTGLSTMNALFMDNLRGLVFIPDAYVGGVESALSYHMDYWKLNVRETAGDSYTTGDFKVSSPKEWNLGLTDTQGSYEAPTLISYHMNPLSAQVTFDQLSIVEKNAELLTRAEGAGIKLDPNYNEGKGVLIDNAKGTLTLSITGTSENYDPAGTTMPIFALQAQVAGKVDEETGEQEWNTVTSDYAMFAQMNVQPSAIQYNMDNYYQQDGGKGGPFNRKNSKDFQEVVTTATAVSDLDAALNNATASTVKWNGSVNLLEVLEIAYKDLVRNTDKAWKSPSEWEKYDLKMNFKLVDYTIGDNTVSESSWAVIDPATGVLTACVNRDASKQSTDELGHMPLVYVTVTQGDNTVLNGFLKVKIVPSEPYYLTDPVKYANIDFNCAEFDEEQLSAYQPLQMILAKTGLSLDVFRANYKAVTKEVEIDGDKVDVFEQFTYVQASDQWTTIAANRQIGYIFDRTKYVNDDYSYDFGWDFDDASAKQLVYQQPNHTATVYICYEGISDVYADVYLPLTVTVNEKPELTVGTKVLAKWFRENNNTALLNVPQPTNDKTVTTIDAVLDQYWTNDKPTFTPKPTEYLNYKYYFSALNNRTVDGAYEDGTKWSIKYSVVNSKNPNLIEGLDAQSNANMGDNALLVNDPDSEYGNDELYADDVLIATLDQTTGEIKYETSEKALVYLNMFSSMGYGDVNRPDAKLGGIVGMVAYSTCDIAYNVTNGDFNVAFLRPINVDPNQGYTFTDATANGSVNNVYDMLAFSDWRDVSFVSSNQWLYGYYNVKSAKPDFEKMTSDIANPGSGKFDPAAESLQKCFVYSGGNVDYSSVTVSDTNGAAVASLVKAGFGTITYNNNDVNVKQFKVKIPFTVEYELGVITVEIECTINTTLGN